MDDKKKDHPDRKNTPLQTPSLTSTDPERAYR